MTIARRLRRYLQERGVDQEVLPHEHTRTSLEIYLEGSDHELLVHVEATSFGELLANATHGIFSRRA